MISRALLPIALLVAWAGQDRPRTTYSSPKIIEPSSGGHASSREPRPEQERVEDDVRRLGNIGAKIDFEDVPIIREKTYFGGAAKDHILESGGAGVALIDYDNDGWLDLYVVNGYELTPKRKPVPHRNLLYRNLGNWKFENVSAKSGAGGGAWGAGVCAGDYNNDGYLDLYVTNYGVNFLYRNNRDGTFTEVARQAGVDHRGWSTGCTFFDADGDGNLDLYVANYIDVKWEDVLLAKRTLLWRGGPLVMNGPAGMRGGSDVFYHNQGDGTFVQRNEWLGLKSADTSYGFGVLATDVNGDGWVDVFVANDTTPNFLFRNRGDGRFDEIALESGVALNADGRAQAGMGVSAADFDGDGRLDLVLTTFAQDTNTIYRNLGGGRFEDVSEAVGLKSRTFDRLGWGVTAMDVDLDGAPDLFFANGHIYPQVDGYPGLRESYRQQNQLLLNRGGHFFDASSIAGSALVAKRSHRGLAIGDLDNDGRPDVVLTAIDEAPVVLRNRTTSDRHWLGVQLRKDGTNRFCIGATVTVSGQQRQVQEIRSGGSYVSQNDLRLHFGLGEDAGPVDVRVRMPGGREWVFRDVAVDRITPLSLR